MYSRFATIYGFLCHIWVYALTPSIAFPIWVSNTSYIALVSSIRTDAVLNIWNNIV